MIFIIIIMILFFVVVVPQDTITFVQLVSSAVPVICQLLHSRQTTDVIEAVDFFTSAYKFGLAEAIVGVQQMLVLIWSQDQAVRDAVAVAYKKLYLNTESTTPRYTYNFNLFNARFVNGFSGIE